VTRAGFAKLLGIALLATSVVECAPAQRAAHQAVFVFVRLSGPAVGALPEVEAALKIGERLGGVVPPDVGSHAGGTMDGRWVVLTFCGPDADRLASAIATRIEQLPPGSYMVRRYGLVGAPLGPPEVLAPPGIDIAITTPLGSC
jgi:hypothetical protein